MNYFEQLAAQEDAKAKDKKSSGNYFYQLANQGGEKSNEDQKPSQPQAYQDRNAGREADQQEPPVGSEAGIQADGLLRPEDQSQRERNDQTRVSDEGQTQDAQGGIQGSQAGEGLEGQVPARNQEEIDAGGVQSPKGNFFERLAAKAKARPKEAAIVAVEAGIGTAIDLAVGGSVAAGVSTLAELGTFGAATPAVPAIAMAGMAAGTWASSKIRKGIEDVVGIGETVREAEKGQEELAQAAGIAAMIPQGAKSLTRLAGMGIKKGLKKAAIGAPGGAVFEPIRYGVEAVGGKLLGEKEGPSPITLASIGESALFGAVMAGHAAKKKKGQDDIANAGLPKTSKVAGEVKSDQAIEKTADLLEPKKESEGVRIGAAAWRNQRTGAVFYGKDHEEALQRAREAAQDPEQKDKVAIGDLPQVDTTKPENRETEDFGFITKDGEFVSRDEAQKFAEQSGQFKGKQTDRPVMHSNEVQLDFYEKPSEKPRQLAGAAAKSEFTESRLSEGVKAMDDAEKAKGRPLDVNNEGDKRAWLQELNKRFDLGTFTLDEQNSLWNQAHEAYRIRNAAGKTIPAEQAVRQIGGQRIQNQRILAAKNEEINKRREARGDAPLLPGREITELGAWQEAAKKIAEDPQYLYNLTNELKQGKRAATAEESLALLQHRGEIENRIDDLSEKRNNETDPTKISAIDVRLEKEYNDLRDAEQVYRNVGTEVSAALRIRRIQAAADFSLPRVIARQEKAKGRKLTKEELRSVKADLDKVKKVTDELSGINKDRIEQRQDSDIEKETEQPKKKSKLSAEDEIKKFTAKLQDNKDNPGKLSRTMKNLARAIARQRLEYVEAKLGRELSKDEQKQVTKPRDLSQATHDIAVKELGDNWTLKDTRDAISGYGLYSNPDQSALNLAINRLSGENRNIGKIEDIIQGLAPKRTGKQRVKPDAGERALAKRVNALARKFGIKAQDPEAQLAGALESAKTRAKNLIEELEEIFLKGRPLTEETKAEIAKEDPELANLKGEILGLRQLIEDTYGKREIPIEQKVKSLEKIYDNLIKQYEKEIAFGEVYKTTSKGEPLTSEKLEQQRETLKNLRAERQYIRDADSLRQEAIKVAKAEKRISEISKILSGEAVDPKTGKKIAEGPESKRVTELRNELSKAEKDLKKFRDSLKIKKSEDEKRLDALNRQKTAAEERLARLQTGEKKLSGKDQAVLNKEQRAVKDEIESLNSQIKQYQEASKTRKTEEEKREALLERQIKNQKEILAKQEIKEKEAKTRPTNPRIEALEKELADLKDQTMNEDWYKARKEAIALQAYKNRINTQIEDAKRRLATGDYTKAERKELPIDEEARKKRLELAELKNRIRQNITLEEWKNRPPLQKAADAIIKYKRAAVLSYLSTWGKLTAASLEIPLLRLPTAAVGKVLEKTPFFKEIAERARQEYGSPLSQDVKAYSKGLWDGAKEFKKIAFQLGRSELDLEYGDTSLIPLGALDVPGKVHEAIKNPTKKANYEMAFARYMQWAAREGLIKDAESERLVREKAGIEAYKEANASIFLQDNGLVNKYNLVINKMKESDSWRQRLAARFLEFNIPIVRIPANIVKEALEYQFGFFTGTSKAIRMKMSKEVGKRLEDISPEDADVIMRQIKKGSVGLMAMAIGYALPDYFGGFYRKGAEKEEETPEYGGIGPIPKTLLHHPAFVPFQIGATLRKVWDESMFDRQTFGDDASAIARGFAEGQMGLLEELPFVNLSRNVGKYVDPSRLGETGGECAKSLIPGFVQETAKVLDVPEASVGETLKTLFWDKKHVTKRKAETFMDHIYEGTPLLREKVEPK
jgi:hypothetical protein